MGAAEAGFLIVDLSRLGNLTTVDRRSEQYKLGQNVGDIGSGVAAVVPVGLSNFILKKFGKAGAAMLRRLRVSSKLDWSIVNKAGETRPHHVRLHNVDNSLKPAHGVFLEDAVTVTNEALERAQKLGLKPVANGSVDILDVPMGRQIGWEGGIAGSEAAIPKDTVRIILQSGTNKLITAFPF